MNVFRLRRLEQNLSIEDVVNEICYPVSIIRKIEDDVENFLPKPYSYYCIKSYGEYLKISNLEELLLKYK